MVVSYKSSKFSPIPKHLKNLFLINILLILLETLFIAILLLSNPNDKIAPNIALRFASNHRVLLKSSIIFCHMIP